MGEKKPFDLAAALGAVSGLDTGVDNGREQIEYIDIDLIDDDPNNFYEMSGLDTLAANIELIGLQQPIRVRQNPDDPQRFVIVSGHRRRAAIRKLVDDGRQDLREIPCIRDRKSGSDAMTELRLIYANSDTRTMTAADVSRQVKRVEELLYQLKEEGYEFPGRMRDHVAEICKVSRTKLARLKVIRDKLDSVWQPDYEKGALNESVAYALAQIPGEHQRCIREAYTAGAWRLGEYVVGVYGKRLAAIEKLKCKKVSGGACTNIKQMQAKAVRVSQYLDSPCEKCCNSCTELASCKYACPVLADKIKKLKSDKNEAKRQEQLAQEERERPKIEKLQALWMRFGYVREQAKKTAKEVYKAADMFYSSGDDEKMANMESCFPKFTPNTTLPYGYTCRLSDIEHLVNVADLFGCSLDFLLCRTDNPNGLAVPEAPVAPSVSNLDTWQTGEPPATAPGEYVVLLRFDANDRISARIMTWDGFHWSYRGVPFIYGNARVLGCSPMPETSEDTENHLNGECITGASPSGHCGAAAYCNEPYNCCVECPDPCNSQCGWLESVEG